MTEINAMPRAIKVLMATSSFPRGAADWKGRFIHDLAGSLDASDQVRLSLWGPPGVLPGNVVSANSDSDSRWLDEMIMRGGVVHLLRKHPLTGLRYANGILTRLRKACRQNRPDLYHVNWLQLALGLPNDGTPAYVAVLGSDFGLLRLPGMVALLRRAFARRRTLLAPNAEWMVKDLKTHFGDVAEVRANPFGVGQAWFDVTRRPTSPAEWLVVSRVTRKKLGDLMAFGDGLFSKERRLRLLGPMQETMRLPDWIDYEGPTNPGELREHWFPRAAGLISLSHHDEGRPQVMIEAMAAGLPIIASRIPAHEDLIRHGETGWLSSGRQELAKLMQQTESPTAAVKIGSNARAWIRDHIGTWDDSAHRCIAAYRELMAQERQHVA